MSSSLFQVYNNALNRGADRVTENTLTASILLVLTILYSTQLRPNIPETFNYVFTYWPVRLVVLTLALSLFNRNKTMSFLLVSALLAGTHYASAIESFELMDTGVLSVEPNCEAVTYDDLLVAYEGDVDALERFARSAGLPYNRKVKDHAPLVATLMLNNEIPVTAKCSSVYDPLSYESTIN